ncbi:activating signal cointegrator 1 complex subunit 1 isoform X1 [Colias croceus]|uniref:activating signal cointegrator 1 complex subunit 1 isoform X1 n=2 Tax=Colias crocea TaxID=72248 RepID=UPI001E27E749|nr:activating signal cointegrator 1 complex subunit 1 isoform X1 [Colias croceus]
MNDILRPELVWIEGRCYRLNDATSEISTHVEQDLYENEIPFQDMQEDDDDNEFDVEMMDSGRYCTSLHVSKHYLGNIIGKKGAMRMRIQRDTNTDVKIPRIGENKDILIYGPSIANVKAACRRINVIVMSARRKQRATHFISIPLNQPNIQKTFEKFKESVLRECQSRALEESLFIPATKLHLTVGVMCLMDNEERLLVSKLLTEAKERIIMPIIQDHLPLRLRIKGLSYMNDDPKEINVLYSCVEEENAPAGLLQEMVDAIVDFFYKKGFMEKEFGRNNVKMHVTLLNTKYRGRREDDDDSMPRNRGTRQTFDGTDILNKFKDYDFGVVQLTDIHLSQRQTIGPDGYYQPTCVINIS